MKILDKKRGNIAGDGQRRKAYKNIIMDLLCDVTGNIFYAIGIYTFAKMANFAPGGISGLALMMNYLWGLPIGTMTLVLNIPLVVISYRFVGRKFLLKTARTMIIGTIILDVVFPHTPVYTGSPFMAVLYSGIFMGIGLAIIYMRGSSSGGVDFLVMTVRVLRPHLSIGVVTMAIDLVIIVLGWPAFGNVDAVLYGLGSMLLASIVIDKIMYGLGAGTLAIIITVRGKEVADRISEIIDRGSTELGAKGTYTQEDKKVLLCACSNSQSYMVKKAVQEIDPGAFVMLTQTSQVFGEGFIEANEKGNQ